MPSSILPEYDYFLKPLKPDTKESILLQMEFNQTRGKEIENPHEALQIASWQLLEAGKVRDNYFPYFAGHLAINASKFFDILDLRTKLEGVSAFTPIIARALSVTGKIKEVKEIVQKFEEFFKIAESHPFFLLDAKLTKIEAYISLNDYEAANKEIIDFWDTINYIRRHVPDIDLEYFEISALASQSQVSLMMGQLEDCTIKTKEVEKRSKAFQNTELLAIATMIGGLLAGTIRRQEEATQKFQKSYDLFTELKSTYNQAIAKGALGVMALNAGEIKKAEEFLKETLPIFKKFNSIYDIGQFGGFLANIYLSQKRTKDAYKLVLDLDSYLDQLDYFEPMLLLEFAKLGADVDDFQFAEKYLKSAEEALKISYSPISDSEHQSALSYLERKKGNLFSAEKLAEKSLIIAEEKDIYFQIIRGKFRLAIILLQLHQLRPTRKRYINSLEQHLTDLTMLIPGVDSPTAIDLKLAMAGISYIRGAEDVGTDYLEQAKVSAERSNYEKTMERIEKLKNKMNWLVAEISKLEQLQSRTVDDTVSESVEEQGLTISDYRMVMINTVQTLVNRISLKEIPRDKILTSKPLSLFVVSESGLPLFSYHFSKTSKDELLISGFLSAISSFSNAVMQTQGKLKTIHHEKYAILLESLLSKNIIFALVVDKETYESRKKLRSFCNQVNQLPDDKFLEPLQLEPSLQNDLEKLAKTVFDFQKKADSDDKKKEQTSTDG